MMKKKKWADLMPVQKILAIVAGTIQIGLLVSALWDIQRRPNDEFRGNKWVWTAVVFINFIGPITYFLFGRVPDSELLAPLSEEAK